MFPKNLSRLVVCHHKVDFRKQWNGLFQEAERLGYHPYDGDLVVFARRDKRQLRALCGDDKGLYLFSRRFEGGNFSFVFSDKVQVISRQKLESWFEGRQVIVKKIPAWRKTKKIKYTVNAFKFPVR